jgi:phosphoribosylglycinamide formyltransferase-1
LVSGSGTILEAMIEAGVAVAMVIADRPCRGLEIARNAGITALLVDRGAYGGFRSDFDRDGYSQALTDALVEHKTDLVAMAGFGTVLTAPLHAAFPGRVLNTHPSLLPAFKGWHAVAQALASGESETGCTVHVATEALDDGPILAQERVAISPEDDESSLHERIKSVERTLYPQVVATVMMALERGEEPSTLARI